jgi:hypothetical protein
MSVNEENVTMSVGDGSITLEEGATINQAAPAVAPAPAAAPAAAPKLDLNKAVTIPLHLLINLRQIIDVSVTRGTYKSNELTSVGKVYDDLVSSLKPHLA